MLNKIKNQTKLLRERIRYYDRNGIEDNEYFSAKKILKSILDKYGWSESDISDAPDQRSSYFFKTWVPSIKEKKNPDWLKILASLVSGVYGVKCLSLDRLGFHIAATSSEAVADTEEKLSYLVNRSVTTFSLYNNFTKKIDKTSYLLGFAFGYEEYLKNKMATEAEKNEADSGQAKTLTIIGQALLNLDKAYENMKDDGTIKPEAVNTDVKDQSAFLIGFHDGMKAEEKLITEKK